MIINTEALRNKKTPFFSAPLEKFSPQLWVSALKWVLVCLALFLSGPNLTVPKDDELTCRQIFEPHRSE